MHEAIIQIGGFILMISLLTSFFFKCRAITYINIPASSFIAYLIRPVNIPKLKKETLGLPAKGIAYIKNANYCLYAWYVCATLVVIDIAYLVKTGQVFQLHDWIIKF